MQTFWERKAKPLQDSGRLNRTQLCNWKVPLKKGLTCFSSGARTDEC